jgi:hypothetical protein
LPFTASSHNTLLIKDGKSNAQVVESGLKHHVGLKRQKKTAILSLLFC